MLERLELVYGSSHLVLAVKLNSKFGTSTKGVSLEVISTIDFTLGSLLSRLSNLFGMNPFFFLFFFGELPSFLYFFLVASRGDNFCSRGLPPWDLLLLLFSSLE